MKNERTPRSLAESSFTTGYPDKPFHHGQLRPKEPLHTWAIVVLGLIGMLIVWWTR